MVARTCEDHCFAAGPMCDEDTEASAGVDPRLHPRYTNGLPAVARRPLCSIASSIRERVSGSRYCATTDCQTTVTPRPRSSSRTRSNHESAASVSTTGLCTPATASAALMRAIRPGSSGQYVGQQGESTLGARRVDRRQVTTASFEDLEALGSSGRILHRRRDPRIFEYECRLTVPRVKSPTLYPKSGASRFNPALAPISNNRTGAPKRSATHSSTPKSTAERPGSFVWTPRKRAGRTSSRARSEDPFCGLPDTRRSESPAYARVERRELRCPVFEHQAVKRSKHPQGGRLTGRERYAVQELCQISPRFDVVCCPAHERDRQGGAPRPLDGRRMLTKSRG